MRRAALALTSLLLFTSTPVGATEDPIADTVRILQDLADGKVDLLVDDFLIAVDEADCARVGRLGTPGAGAQCPDLLDYVVPACPALHPVQELCDEMEASCVDFEYHAGHPFGVETINLAREVVQFGADGAYEYGANAYDIVPGLWTVSRSSNIGLDCKLVDSKEQFEEAEWH